MPALPTLGLRAGELTDQYNPKRSCSPGAERLSAADVECSHGLWCREMEREGEGYGSEDSAFLLNELSECECLGGGHTRDQVWICDNGTSQYLIRDADGVFNYRECR